MVKYIKANSYLIVKQFAYQFLSMIMGLILYFNVYASSSIWLKLAVTLFSIGFYMVIQYTGFWDAGASDIIKIEGKRLKYRPWAGLVMSLIASAPNFILAALITMGNILGKEGGRFAYEWAGNIGAISRTIAIFWEAPYDGIINLYSPNNPIIFWLIPLPAIFFAGLGYYAGLKNFTIIRIKKKNKKKY